MFHGMEASDRGSSGGGGGAGAGGADQSIKR